MNKVKVFKLDPDAKVPTRNKSTDAGLDLYAAETVYIPKGATARIKTGVAIEIPEGYVGRISDRSGMAAKGLAVGAGVIDTGYTGDHTVVLHNVSNETSWSNGSGYQVNKGDKIAQLIIYPIVTPEVEVVELIWTSERGAAGFGSSGT
jgi:dUTP pyrophosphatase